LSVIFEAQALEVVEKVVMGALFMQRLAQGFLRQVFL